MYDFFSIDYDYGDGVHIHSMCRQVNGCWNWVGHDFVYEKGRTNGSDYAKPQQSPIPADLLRGPSSHHQEQIDTLYYVNKGEPRDEARAVAESSATAVMGRISAYTGQQVFWDEMMVDPNKKPGALQPDPEALGRGFREGHGRDPERKRRPRPRPPSVTGPPPRTAGVSRRRRPPPGTFSAGVSKRDVSPAA